MKNTPAPSAAAGAGGTAAPGGGGGGRKQEGWASRGVSTAPRWIHTAATSRASFRERNPPQEITRWFLPPRNPYFSRQTSPNLLLLLPLWRGSDPGRLRAAHVPQTTNSTGQRQPRCRHHLYAFILPFITHKYQSSPHTLTPRSAFWLRASPAAGHGEEKPRGADPSPAQRQAAGS